MKVNLKRATLYCSVFTFGYGCNSVAKQQLQPGYKERTDIAAQDVNVLSRQTEVNIWERLGEVAKKKIEQRPLSQTEVNMLERLEEAMKKKIGQRPLAKRFLESLEQEDPSYDQTYQKNKDFVTFIGFNPDYKLALESFCKVLQEVQQGKQNKTVLKDAQKRLIRQSNKTMAMILEGGIELICTIVPGMLEGLKTEVMASVPEKGKNKITQLLLDVEGLNDVLIKEMKDNFVFDITDNIQGDFDATMEKMLLSKEAVSEDTIHFVVCGQYFTGTDSILMKKLAEIDKKLTTIYESELEKLEQKYKHCCYAPATYYKSGYTPYAS